MGLLLSFDFLFWYMIRIFLLFYDLMFMMVSLKCLCYSKVMLQYVNVDM